MTQYLVCHFVVGRDPFDFDAMLVSWDPFDAGSMACQQARKAADFVKICTLTPFPSKSSKPKATERGVLVGSISARIEPIVKAPRPLKNKIADIATPPIKIVSAIASTETWMSKFLLAIRIGPIK